MKGSNPFLMMKYTTLSESAHMTTKQQFTIVGTRSLRASNGSHETDSRRTNATRRPRRMYAKGTAAGPKFNIASPPSP